MKSPYSLKQDPRQSNVKLIDILIKFEFNQRKFDHSLCTQKVKKGITVLPIYVDNMVITRHNLEHIEETRKTLQLAFKMKDLREFKYFLGIEFARSDQGILMHQRKYAMKFISKLGLSAFIAETALIDCDLKLTDK